VSGTKYERRGIRLPSLGTAVRFFRFGPDVTISVEFTPIAFLGVLVGKIVRARTVLLLESDPTYRGVSTSPVVLAFKRIVVRMVDVALTSNRGGAQYLVKDLRADPGKVVVGPYLTSVPPKSADASEGQWVGSCSGRTNLLFVNSVTDRKGVKQFILALAATSNEVRSKIEISIVGDGDYLESAKALTIELKLDQIVTFHGRIAYKRLHSFYERTSLVVCPTLADYRSLSGFEAVASGKPSLISVRDGAHQEFRNSSMGATIFDPMDPLQFARVLEQFVMNPELLREMAVEAEQSAGRVAVATVVDNLRSVILGGESSHGG